MILLSKNNMGYIWDIIGISMRYTWDIGYRATAMLRRRIKSMVKKFLKLN